MSVPATLPELLRILYAARSGGVRLDLERVRECLHRLGDPQNKFVCVHVGGTNGKGSTAVFVASMLQHAGVRAGLFTSPHLSRFDERFVIDGSRLDDAVILRAGQRVHAVISDMAEAPTFFERITAMALCAFASANVDVAVLEVGLGGRFDATSVVGAPVAAVTGVALDHERYLGSDLASIAREKAGIFKRGQRALVGCAGDPDAVPLLLEGAKLAGVASVRAIDESSLPADVKLGIPGAHQRGNAALALAIMRALSDVGVVSPDEDTLRLGLEAAQFPGRMETLTDAPLVVADGAHNPHAAATLARSLAAEGIEPDVVVLGVSSDKDLAGIATPLLLTARTVVATQSRQARSLPAGDVAKVIKGLRPGLSVEIVPAVADAIDTARRAAGPTGSVLVTGSLFVVGEARERLCGAVADPLDLSDPL